MALLTPPNESEVFLASKVIRENARYVVGALEQKLSAIAALATIHTKAALAAELGGDAAAFATFYDSARDLLVSLKPSTTVPARADLP